MRFDICHDSRCVFEGTLLDGSVVERTSLRTTIRDARIKGRLKLHRHIPCCLDPPHGRVLMMTSGRPHTSHCDTAYSPVDDIAIRFRAESVRLSSQTVEAKGDPCIIEVIPDYFKRSFNPYFVSLNKRQCPRAPVGWLSWYCFFGDFDEEKAKRIAAFAAHHLKPYGFEYVLVEAWQQNSDRLPVKEYFHNLDPDPRKFPRGLRHVTEMLHRKGLKAGIWLVPLGTGETPFYGSNKDMFIRHPSGRPVSNWNGRYLLDPTHPRAQTYIKKMIRTVVRDWGFDYLKIDGLELGTGYARQFFDRPRVRKLLRKKRGQPLRDVLTLMRRSMGRKTFLLACGAETNNKSRCPGLVDGARIGTDVFYDGENPSWGAVLHTARVTTSAYHLHNIAWYNDPDVLSIRKPLSLAHARMLCTIIGLTGQVLFSSDILYELPRQRVRMLQQLMPVCDTYPAHLAVNKKLQPIWNLAIRRRFEQWNVVALFNWHEYKDVTIAMAPSELGLDPASRYLVYDFWADRYVGLLHGPKEVRLKKQSCMLVAIRQEENHPQFLSVSRHITQGGVCVKEIEWNRRKLCLSADMNLPRGESFTTALYVPQEYQLRAVMGTAKRVSRAHNIVKLRVTDGRWKCLFEHL